MNGKYLIPGFGALEGTRVLCAGTVIAMPFAATMMADFGAQVIHIERPGVGDPLRIGAPQLKNQGKSVSTGWAQDARNKLSLSLELDLHKGEIRELFFDLIRNSDIFMENMVWLDKLGIKDEELLEVNPRLVITHFSGMGHKEFGGEEAMCNRASYDVIGQAFSGWLSLQGDPDRPPVFSKPYTNDYVTSFAALFGTLSAYINVLKTGKGQVVDVAQFEAMAQYMCGYYVEYAALGSMPGQTPNKNPFFQPYDLFKSADGFYVALGAFGPAVYRRCLEAMGLDAEYYSHAECASGPEAVSSEKGRELDGKIRSWFLSRSASEAEKVMETAKVPCSTVNTIASCFENQHFKDREDFVKYVDQSTGLEISAFGIAPKMSRTPGKIWRGAPAIGQDTDRILRELLGYSDEKIAKLRGKGYI